MALKRFAEVLQTGLGVTSAVVLFLMMAITAVDVAGRYVLNMPLKGGFEMTELLLAALIYCGLPLVSRRREHIVIDTFDPLYPPRLKRALDIVAEVICAATLSGLGYLIFVRAVRVAQYGDTTTVLKLPLAPIVYLMGVMIVVAALIHVSLILVPHGEDDGKTIV
ncbi:MAG: TRAP transporter small permease [Burkholderiales bacterium]|nr:TRAP transporter small permease [Burkholderiales bacterium]